MVCAFPPDPRPGGVERPLRNAQDWKKFIGRDAVVTADHLQEDGTLFGSREVRIAGIEGETGQETIVVEDASGATHRVPLAAVKKARLAFNWKGKERGWLVHLKS